MNSGIRIVIALAIVACTGCAALEEAAQPSRTQTATDAYDGATIVRQPAVIAGTNYTGDWNALGFEWTSKFPNRVLLSAGTRGVIKVTDLVLDIDGEPAAVQIASELTDYGDSKAAERWSMRRFEISWADFKRMASARTVRMRVVGTNEMFVTSFGSDHVGAPVNATMPAFVAKVRKLRGEISEPREPTSGDN